MSPATCARLIVPLTMLLASYPHARAAEHLILAAKVNGSPVRLAFDTGAEQTCLFRATAQRLGLPVKEVPAGLPQSTDGRVRMAATEECRFAIGQAETTIRLPVLDVPPGLDAGCDGILAWANVRANLLRVSADARQVVPLDRLPKDIGSWQQWELREKARVLGLELPGKEHAGRAIYVDTGSPFGVHLDPARWKDWLRGHAAQPATLAAWFTPGSGLVVSEVHWANQLDIGPLSMRDVPVLQSAPGMDQMFEGAEAVLGLFALTRVDLVLDGRASKAYTRPNPRPLSRYVYNRLGAVFVPRDPASQDLVARVQPGSPAYEAGIRDGDILQSVDGRDIGDWRTNPAARPDRHWEQPAGTKYTLVLERKGERREMKVELRDIFPAPPATTMPVDASSQPSRQEPTVLKPPGRSG